MIVGVGGQGTLLTSRILGKLAIGAGYDVKLSEVHGMAQRGGVVESTILLGGWKSPKIGHGEADLILGFEPLETLRGMTHLAAGGSVLSNTEPLPPVGVSTGREAYPEMERIRAKVEGCAAKSWFLPCRTLGLQAGSVQAGNSVLLGAACATGLLPFGPDALEAAIRIHLAPKLMDMNLRAVELGVRAVASAS